MPVVSIDFDNDSGRDELDCDYFCRSANDFNGLSDGTKIAAVFAITSLFITIAVAVGFCVVKGHKFWTYETYGNRRNSQRPLLHQTQSAESDVHGSGAINDIEVARPVMPHAVLRTAHRA